MYDAKTYDAAYYLEDDKCRSASAKCVLEELFKLYHPASVVDFGCGLGHWLEVCHDDFKIEQIHGIDGNAVDPQFFKIAPECHTQADFEKPIELEKQYELAMSIEVAEHLSPDAAESFVQSITKAANVVLFSAAAPYQGGVCHLNEQPPAYWAKLFAKCGYACFDILRDRLWDKEGVHDVHRQNMMVFVHADDTYLFTDQGYQPTENPQLKYHPLFVERHLKKRCQKRRQKEMHKATIKSWFGLK